VNTSLLQYIRHLAKQDKKSLTQKTLKTVEEVGELAKVVLPYENAYATTHRFIERERILEEAVDTTLCALSVAYDLNFTDEEIEEMILRKAEKWALLQAKEEKVTYPLPFEIHITVNLRGSPEWENRPLDPVGSVEVFKQKCQMIGVKPIILDLQNTTGASVMTDVMTSSKHFGDNRSAYDAACTIKDELVYHGFDVVRVKIETVPWHPAAPSKHDEPMPPNCYFESHIPVTLNENDIPSLSTLVESGELQFPVHMSRNVFKRTDNGRVVVMLTYRSQTGSQSSFELITDLIVRQLQSANIEVGKVHKEFAVYDTKVTHDASWILAQ